MSVCPLCRRELCPTLVEPDSPQAKDDCLQEYNDITDQWGAYLPPDKLAEKREILKHERGEK